MRVFLPNKKYIYRGIHRHYHGTVCYVTEWKHDDNTVMFDDGVYKYHVPDRLIQDVNALVSKTESGNTSIWVNQETGLYHIVNSNKHCSNIDMVDNLTAADVIVKLTAIVSKCSGY
jgi:hypothetical protein